MRGKSIYRIVKHKSSTAHLLSIILINHAKVRWSAWEYFVSIASEYAKMRGSTRQLDRPDKEVNSVSVTEIAGRQTQPLVRNTKNSNCWFVV